MTQLERSGEGDSRRLELKAKEIMRRFIGKVAWPTVFLCGGLDGCDLLVVAGWWVGAVPLCVGCMVNSALSYAFYTVHHDANHKAISGRNAGWLWLDTLCGSIAAIPLQLSFSGFSSEHLRHHAHTSDRQLDPDIAVAGPLWAVPLKWIVGTLFGVIQTLPWGAGLARLLLPRLRADLPTVTDERIRQENMLLRRYARICMVVLLASIPLGLFVPMFSYGGCPDGLRCSR
jgi:fatty acid desaturase